MAADTTGVGEARARPAATGSHRRGGRKHGRPSRQRDQGGKDAAPEGQQASGDAAPAAMRGDGGAWSIRAVGRLRRSGIQLPERAGVVGFPDWGRAEPGRLF